MPKLFALNFRTGLLIGCAIAIAVAAAAITYERYDTKTLKRTIRATPCIAASTPACPASPAPTTRATGRASTSISAAPSRRRSSTIRTRSSSCRSTPRSGSPSCKSARSTCWRATRPGPCRAKPNTTCISPGCPTYDGQGFMVPRARNINSALELDGSKVCVQGGHHHRAQSRRLLPRQQHEV